MRNLELLTHLQLSACLQCSHADCMCVDYDTGNVYTASSSGITGMNPHTEQVTGSVTFALCDDFPQDGLNKTVGIEFLPDQQSVCVATDNGSVLLWNIFADQVECVGNVESGLTAMSWSPDQELLILTTGQDTVIMMTREFDPVTEKSLHPENFGAAQFVNVGWGKKETQFHGSLGKEAAKVKKEEVSVALPWDDRKPRISWRGDGQCFVISTICPLSGARKLRVWNRECEHQSTSENVEGIEHALCWKPSGSLIATTQRRPNKHDVIFFEKNGLRHGEFSLLFGVKDVVVKELLWNMDSTLLAVWCQDLVSEGSENPPRSYIQIWSVGNYHWYLKQNLQFSGIEDDKISAVVWDPEHAYRLHIFCVDGKYLQYTWCWATHSSRNALVSVIDGYKVLMTPMQNLVVPPPMSAYYLQLNRSVNHLAFCCHGNPDDILLLLDDGTIVVYKFEDCDNKDNSIVIDAAGGSGFNRSCTTPHRKGEYRITGLPDTTMTVHHIVWYSSELVLFCCVDQKRNQNSTLFSCSFSEGSIAVKSSVDIDGIVFKMCVDTESRDNIMAIQLTDGSILQYNTEDEMILPWEINNCEELSFPIPCQQMALCEIGGQKVVLGLTNRYRFYVNSTEIASNCTSFAIHKEYLLLTTLSHTVRCICRKTRVEVLPTLSDGKAHPFDESIRRVERGSRIVTVVPDDTKFVLQMPRGNLETIHPRALVLSVVRKHLDELKFKDAMAAMRKHRINLNLIYDHQPDNFLNHIQQFIQQINNVNHINLFLSDLQEEDVTLTMYTAAYNRNPRPDDAPTQSKVDTVCDAIRQALISLHQNKYILGILTSYVKKSTPELEEALLLVRSLRDNPCTSHVISPVEALKYLLFLVDVNEMFDVALGTYDFDLVLMVAEKSQKDPKEYIPFLNGLRRLEGSYQHYVIDKHLKRYSRALTNISKCPEHFDECLSLIREHSLHSQALKLFPVSSSQYKDVAKLYGEYLTGKRKHEEAGLIYIKAEEWKLALEAFQSCINWRQAFCMAAKLKYSKENQLDLANKLAFQLRSQKSFVDAAAVLEQYADDREEAIVCLVEGCQWEEALRMMYKYNRTDFIETNLKSAMIDSFDNQMESLENMKCDFDKYRKRLIVVREEKEKARLEFLETGGVGINDADADLFSDVSSATGESTQSSRYSGSQQSSVYSRSTGRTSRNRRKAEHKKWKLKEGSQYEDFALIAALSRIITVVDSMRNEVHDLVKCLVQFHYDKQASTLQTTYGTFLSTIDSAIPNIWLENTEDENQLMTLGPNATANSIAQAVQRGQSLTIKEKTDPIISQAPTLHKDIKWKLHILDNTKTEIK